MSQLWPILLAAFAATVVLLAIRLKLRGALWLALGTAPFLLVYLVNEDLRVFSSHGFVHTGVVYQIMNGQIPPPDPLLGGEVLGYPWAHHLLIAQIVSVFGISPATAFALVNLTALTLTLLVVYRAGLLLSNDRNAAILGTTLGVIGITCVNWGVVNRVLRKLTGLDIFGVRDPTVALKFTNLTGMSLGYLFFALGIYALIRMVNAPERAGRSGALLGLSFLGAGLFYPILGLGLGLSCLVAGVVLLIHRGWGTLPPLLWGALWAAFAALPLLPYVMQTSAGKARSPMAFVPDPAFALQKVFWWVFTLGLLGLIVAWQRQALRDLLRERTEAAIVVLSAVAATGLAYVVISTEWYSYEYPDHLRQIEYKFLGMSSLAFGMLAGSSMERLRQKSLPLCLAVLALCMIPTSADWIGKLRASDFIDPIVDSGPHLRHADAAEDALYSWVSSETDVTALFLDTRLTIPIFGRRQLYVGYDQRRLAKKPRPRDGYGYTVEDIVLGWFAHPPDIFAARTGQARELFAPDGGESGERDLDGALAEIGTATPGVDVYVVGRTPDERVRFEASPKLTRVFRGQERAVYRLDGRGTDRG